MIAYWPKGIKAKNSIRHEHGHLIDLMATCVDLAGAKYPKQYGGKDILPLEGRSLVPGFSKDRVAPEDERSLMFEHYGKAAIRKGKWKLVRLGYRKKWELFDMEQDRIESNDLSEDKPELKAKLLQEWSDEALRTRIYPRPGQKLPPN